MAKLYCLIIALGLVFNACNAQKEPGNNSSADKRIKLSPEESAKLSNDLNLDYLTGKFDPVFHHSFTEIPVEMADKKGMLLRIETLNAFKRMYLDAKKEGIILKIISATRSFSHQKRIWEAKWNGDRLVDGQDLSASVSDPVQRALKILEYSSMPGTSRHHWGTEIDLNSLDPAYFEQGKGKSEYDWLSMHAADYGFCQPYTMKGTERPFGYQEEKWHWSFYPVSGKLTQMAAQKLSDGDISGFAGSKTALEIEVVRKYILGINQQCLID